MRTVTGGKVWRPSESDNSSAKFPAPGIKVMPPITSSTLNLPPRKPRARRQKLAEFCDSSAYVNTFMITSAVPIVAAILYFCFRGWWQEPIPVQDYSAGGLPVDALLYASSESSSFALTIILSFIAIPIIMAIFAGTVFKDRAVLLMVFIPVIAGLIAAGISGVAIQLGPFNGSTDENARQWMKDKYGFTLEGSLGSGSSVVKVSDDEGFVRHVDVYINGDKLFLYETPEQLAEAKKG